jgi:hypothetical protein
MRRESFKHTSMKVRMIFIPINNKLHIINKSFKQILGECNFSNKRVLCRALLTRRPYQNCIVQKWAGIYRPSGGQFSARNCLLSTPRLELTDSWSYLPNSQLRWSIINHRLHREFRNKTFEFHFKFQKNKFSVSFIFPQFLTWFKLNYLLIT